MDNQEEGQIKSILVKGDDRPKRNRRVSFSRRNSQRLFVKHDGTPPAEPVYTDTQVRWNDSMGESGSEGGTPLPRVSREGIPSPGGVGVRSPGDCNAPLVVRGLPSHQKRRRASKEAARQQQQQQQQENGEPNIMAVPTDRLPPESFETPDREVLSQSVTSKRVATGARSHKEQTREGHDGRRSSSRSRDDGRDDDTDSCGSDMDMTDQSSIASAPHNAARLRYAAQHQQQRVPLQQLPVHGSLSSSQSSGGGGAVSPSHNRSRQPPPNLLTMTPPTPDVVVRPSLANFSPSSDMSMESAASGGRGALRAQMGLKTPVDRRRSIGLLGEDALFTPDDVSTRPVAGYGAQQSSQRVSNVGQYSPLVGENNDQEASASRRRSNVSAVSSSSAAQSVADDAPDVMSMCSSPHPKRSATDEGDLADLLSSPGDVGGVSSPRRVSSSTLDRMLGSSPVTERPRSILKSSRSGIVASTGVAPAAVAVSTPTKSFSDPLDDILGSSPPPPRHSQLSSNDPPARNIAPQSPVASRDSLDDMLGSDPPETPPKSHAVATSDRDELDDLLDSSPPVAPPRPTSGYKNVEVNNYNDALDDLLDSPPPARPLSASTQSQSTTDSLMSLESSARGHPLQNLGSSPRSKDDLDDMLASPPPALPPSPASNRVNGEEIAQTPRDALDDMLDSPPPVRPRSASSQSQSAPKSPENAHRDDLDILLDSPVLELPHAAPTCAQSATAVDSPQKSSDAERPRALTPPANRSPSPSPRDALDDMLASPDGSPSRPIASSSQQSPEHLSAPVCMDDSMDALFGPIEPVPPSTQPQPSQSGSVALDDTLDAMLDDVEVPQSQPQPPLDVPPQSSGSHSSSALDDTLDNMLGMSPPRRSSQSQDPQATASPSPNQRSSNVIDELDDEDKALASAPGSVSASASRPTVASPSASRGRESRDALDDLLDSPPPKERPIARQGDADSYDSSHHDRLVASTPSSADNVTDTDQSRPMSLSDLDSTVTAQGRAQALVGAVQNSRGTDSDGSVSKNSGPLSSKRQKRRATSATTVGAHNRSLDVSAADGELDPNRSRTHGPFSARDVTPPQGHQSEDGTAAQATSAAGADGDTPFSPPPPTKPKRQNDGSPFLFTPSAERKRSIPVLDSSPLSQKGDVSPTPKSSSSSSAATPFSPMASGSAADGAAAGGFATPPAHTAAAGSRSSVTSFFSPKTPKMNIKASPVVNFHAMSTGMIDTPSHFPGASLPASLNPFGLMPSTTSSALFTPIDFNERAQSRVSMQVARGSIDVGADGEPRSHVAAAAASSSSSSSKSTSNTACEVGTVSAKTQSSPTSNEEAKSSADTSNDEHGAPTSGEMSSKEPVVTSQSAPSTAATPSAPSAISAISAPALGSHHQEPKGWSTPADARGNDNTSSGGSRGSGLPPSLPRAPATASTATAGSSNASPSNLEAAAVMPAVPVVPSERGDEEMAELDGTDFTSSMSSSAHAAAAPGRFSLSQFPDDCTIVRFGIGGGSSGSVDGGAPAASGRVATTIADLDDAEVSDAEGADAARAFGGAEAEASVSNFKSPAKDASGALLLGATGRRGLADIPEEDDVSSWGPLPLRSASASAPTPPTFDARRSSVARFLGENDRRFDAISTGQVRFQPGHKRKNRDIIARMVATEEKGLKRRHVEDEEAKNPSPEPEPEERMSIDDFLHAVGVKLPKFDCRASPRMSIGAGISYGPAATQNMTVAEKMRCVLLHKPLLEAYIEANRQGMKDAREVMAASEAIRAKYKTTLYTPPAVAHPGDLPDTREAAEQRGDAPPPNPPIIEHYLKIRNDREQLLHLKLCMQRLALHCAEEAKADTDRMVDSIRTKHMREARAVADTALEEKRAKKEALKARIAAMQEEAREAADAAHLARCREIDEATRVIRREEELLKGAREKHVRAQVEREARERSDGERRYIAKLQHDLDAGCHLTKMWPRVMTNRRFVWAIGSKRVEFSADIDCSGGESVVNGTQRVFNHTLRVGPPTPIPDSEWCRVFHLRHPHRHESMIHSLFRAIPTKELYAACKTKRQLPPLCRELARLSRSVFFLCDELRALEFDNGRKLNKPDNLAMVTNGLKSRKYGHLCKTGPIDTFVRPQLLKGNSVPTSIDDEAKHSPPEDNVFTRISDYNQPICSYVQIDINNQTSPPLPRSEFLCVIVVFGVRPHYPRGRPTFYFSIVHPNAKRFGITEAQVKQIADEELSWAPLLTPLTNVVRRVQQLFRNED